MNITILKYHLNSFLLTSIISTSLFFGIGNLIFKGIIDFDDWTWVVLTVQITLSFLLLLPLVLPFEIVEQNVEKTRRNGLFFKTIMKVIIGTIYIASILWLLIFKDQHERIENPGNYYDNLKYLGLSSLLMILTFLTIEIIKQRKLHK